MNFNRKVIPLAVLLAAVQIQCKAADSDSNMRVHYPHNARSCGQFVDARDQGRRGNYQLENMFAAWIQGYMTGLNSLLVDTYDIAGSTDEDALELWLENYCKANPLDSFPKAVDGLIGVLYPKRLKTAPKNEQ